MMGGGVCWLDYNNDGWLDLFVVNSYSDVGRRSLGEARWTAAERALPERPRHVRERQQAVARGPPGAGGRAASRPTSTATATPTSIVTTTTDDKLLWNNGNGTFTEGAQAAGIDAVRLAHRRRGRRRQRRRPPRSVRRRLHRSEHAGPELDRRLPVELRGRPRPALPQRGQRRARTLEVPRGRRPGGPRVGRLPATASARSLHRLQRRRTARPLRRRTTRTRTSSTRTFPGPVARGRPGRARLPLRGARRRGGRRRPERRDGHRVGRLQRRRPPRPLRDELPRHEPYAAYRAGSTARSAALRTTRAPRSAGARQRVRGLGRLVGRPRATAASPTSFSPTAAIPSRTCAGRRADPGAARASGRAAARAVRERAGHPRRRRAPARQRPRPRSSRLRQRRPHGHRDQHDRRQARAPARHAAERPLARGQADDVLTRRRRRLSSSRTVARSCRRCMRAAATCPPRIHASTSASETRQRSTTLIVRYPWGGETAARRRRRRPDRRRSHPPAHAAAAVAPPPHVREVALHDGGQHGARSRASGTKRRSPLIRRRQPPAAQARNLFDLSAAMWDAWAAYDPKATGYFVTEKAPGRRCPGGTGGRDQLRRLPASALARLVRREPGSHVRPPDATLRSLCY